MIKDVEDDFNQTNLVGVAQIFRRKDKSRVSHAETT